MLTQPSVQPGGFVKLSQPRCTARGLPDSLIKCVFVQGKQTCVGDSVGGMAPTALVQQEVLLPNQGTTAQQTSLAGQQALVHNEQPVALVPFPHYWLQASKQIRAGSAASIFSIPGRAFTLTANVVYLIDYAI